MKIKCHKCGYKQNYKGKLARATCSSCGSKVMVEPFALRPKGKEQKHE